MSTSSTPAGWYPDPYGRHEVRYWDGAIWTEHISNNGVQGVDVPAAPGAVPTTAATPDKIDKQLGKAGVAGAAWQGDGTIFGEPVLVVNQKAKLIELNNEYAVYAGGGNQIGAVRQTGQTMAKKALRLLTSLDQFMTHKLQVVDMGGNVLLQLTRPAKLIKSTIVISNGMGQEIGKIVQENMIGKIHFGLESGGQRLGSINAENWRAWNFNIQDASGVEVARITKTWEGLAKTMFTSADNFVVQIHQPLAEPLRSLVVASALSVDTALKQDSRGLN